MIVHMDDQKRITRMELWHLVDGTFRHIVQTIEYKETKKANQLGEGKPHYFTDGVREFHVSQSS